MSAQEVSAREIDELRARLAGVGEDLRRIRAGEATPGGAGIHDTALTSVEKRLAEAHGRLDQARQSPHAWPAIKVELTRDVHAVSEEFRGLIARADRAQARERHDDDIPPGT